MTAESQSAVAAKLKESGTVLIQIKEAQVSGPSGKFFPELARVTDLEVTMFSRQLWTLLKAGLSLVDSLAAIKDQVSNRLFQQIIAGIQQDIEAGATFSAALQRHPRVFNPFYVSMVKSAELSGRLDEVLLRLASLGEHEQLVRRRIKQASGYPLMVVASIVIGFIFLITLVVPRFARLYNQFTTRLPLPTQVLLGIHYLFTRYWWLLLILAVLAGYAFMRARKDPRGRLIIDTVALRMPVFGPLQLKIILSRFCRSTSLLLQSGVPILQVLDLNSAASGNVVVAGAIDAVKVSVNEGKGMLEPMRASGFFPSVVLQMVSLGERTGKLDELLFHVSEYYDSQVDYTINNLVSLIEPVLIVVLGIAVLGMALGIFMPMWSLMSLFKH